MNRYETHAFQGEVPLIIMTFNKWSGETLACCLEGRKWINLGVPKEPTPTSRFGEPIEPTPTSRFELIEPTPTN